MLLVKTMDVNTTPSLISAVRNGRLEDVQKLINYFDMSSSQAYDLLCCAVEKNYAEIIKVLLINDCRVNVENEDHDTPLHLAVKNANDVIINMLLERNSNIDAKNFSGMTPLHCAVDQEKLVLNQAANVNVRNCNEKVTKTLLDNGANVNAQDKNGKTVLQLAIEECDTRVVELILKYGPDIKNASNKRAFKVAICSAPEYIIKIFLQCGFAVEHEDKNNSKLLHAAVEKGYLYIIDDLLKYGADVNLVLKEGCTPLHSAAEHKQFEVATLLLKHGANVNVKNKIGKTPIFYADVLSDLKIIKLLLTNGAVVTDLLNTAVKKGCKETVEILLQHCADINASDECGRTALHFTVHIDANESQNDDNDKEEILRLLLSRGANVNAQTNEGMTTLHHAVEIKHTKIVKALLEYNADVNSVANNGCTPLHTAIGTKSLEIITMLLDKGVDVNHLSSALAIASFQDYQNVVEVLLKYGADIDSRNEYGKTALHIASEYRSIKSIKVLLDYGSDINIMWRDNYTPLKYAIANFPVDKYNPLSRNETIDILKQHVAKMMCANLYVCEENIACNNNFDEGNFLSKCKEEIDNMKREKISNKISFYDILTKNISQLAIYARNENVAHAIKLADCKLKFPLYANIICNNFKKGMRRKALMEDNHKILYFVFNGLPHNCIEKIYSHLSDEELRNLINACKH